MASGNLAIRNPARPSRALRSATSATQTSASTRRAWGLRSRESKSFVGSNFTRLQASWKRREARFR